MVFWTMLIHAFLPEKIEVRKGPAVTRILQKSARKIQASSDRLSRRHSVSRNIMEIGS